MLPPKIHALDRAHRHTLPHAAVSLLLTLTHKHTHTPLGATVSLSLTPFFSLDPLLLSPLTHHHRQSLLLLLMALKKRRKSVHSTIPPAVIHFRRRNPLRPTRGRFAEALFPSPETLKIASKGGKRRTRARHTTDDTLARTVFTGESFLSLLHHSPSPTMGAVVPA